MSIYVTRFNNVPPSMFLSNRVIYLYPYIHNLRKSMHESIRESNNQEVIVSVMSELSLGNGPE